MVDLSILFPVLGALSSAAIIVTALFVLIQLRQNARLIEATLNQAQANFSLTVLQRITDESFPRRRAKMFVTMQKFRETNWKDAFESPEDLEVRNFAYLYELLGQMARQKIVDLEIVLDTLQYIVVRDWQVFEPHAEYLSKNYGLEFNTYTNFRWLAEEARMHMEHRSEEQRAGAYRGLEHEARGKRSTRGRRTAPPADPTKRAN